MNAVQQPEIAWNREALAPGAEQDA
ncbi:MAG: NADH-quinone oxidoreductase subunit B, partial [Acidiphilium sp.]|nr:NADH-quinone oxidoreductase subunit B [Acidiphilium sp.]